MFHTSDKLYLQSISQLCSHILCLQQSCTEVNKTSQEPIFCSLRAQNPKEGPFEEDKIFFQKNSQIWTRVGLKIPNFQMNHIVFWPLPLEPCECSVHNVPGFMGPPFGF